MDGYIIKSLPAAEYHARPEISVHGLGTFSKCPLKYVYQKENPPKQTDAMWWGSVVHTAVLEPENLDQEYHVVDIKRTSRKAFEEAEAQFAPRQLLTREEYVQAMLINLRVRSHPAAEKLLAMPYQDHAVENSFFWTDPETGVKCRARMDFVTDSGMIVDLKTCASASHDTFAKDAYNFRYHVQASFYIWGATLCGVHADNFVFVCVEKDAPHCVAVYAADPEMLQLGHQTFRKELNEFAECQKTGIWPGYSENIQSLSLPKYAK